MTNEFNILEFAGLSDERPWELSQALPTDLRAVLPTQEQPTMEDVLQALATYVGETIESEPIESPEGDISWATRVRIVGLPTDIVLWIEPLNDATAQAAEVESGCILALQTILHPGDPLTHFANLIRLIAGSDLQVQTICDLPTGRWFPRPILESVFIQDDTEPPEEILWLTHLAESQEEGDPEDLFAWVSTQGLTRCGRVELEMLGVPVILSSEAVHLIDGLAALTLENPLPSAGEAISLGSNLLVSLMPCKQAIEMLTEEMPGREDRAYPSVAVVGADGTLVYPTDALNTLHEGETAIMKTYRSTKRQTLLAQSQWELLLNAAKQIGESEHAACLVQVPWSNTEDEDAPREYLWFRVVETSEQTVTGELAHTPHLVTSLTEGQKETINQEDISDWVVMTPVGPMGPGDAVAIDEFLNQFQS